MKNILVATDFSGSSSNAAMYAAHLTRTLDHSKLILLHCFEPIIIASEVPYPAPYYAGELKESSIKQLNELRSKIADIANPGTSIEILTSDKSITEAIDNIVETQNIDIVLIGSSEKGMFEKVLIGSATRNIIRSCPVPVLVVPNQEIFTSIQNIAFATDLKVQSAIPVQTIKSIVSAFKAKLYIVNAGPDEGLAADTILVQETLHEHWDNKDAEYHYLSGKDIAEDLKKFQNEHQIQLLIIVPRHHNFFESLFHNSITKEFSFDNDIPVLFVKGDKN